MNQPELNREIVELFELVDERLKLQSRFQYVTFAMALLALGVSLIAVAA